MRYAMSYDVTVGTQEFNYTCNVGEFFTDFGVHPRANLSGLSPESAMIAIASALYLISREEYDALCDKYNAPNGWGSVAGATQFLFDIYLACLTAPDGTIVGEYT